MVLFTPAKKTPKAHLNEWLRSIDLDIPDISEASGCIISLGYDSPPSLGDASWQEVAEIYAYHQESTGTPPLGLGRAFLRLIHFQAV